MTDAKLAVTDAPPTAVCDTAFVIVEKKGYCFLGDECKMHDGRRTMPFTSYAVCAICNTLDRAKSICDIRIKEDTYDNCVACMFVNAVG